MNEVKKQFKTTEINTKKGKMEYNSCIFPLNSCGKTNVFTISYNNIVSNNYFAVFDVVSENKKIQITQN